MSHSIPTTQLVKELKKRVHAYDGLVNGFQGAVFPWPRLVNAWSTCCVFDYHRTRVALPNMSEPSPRMVCQNAKLKRSHSCMGRP